MITETGKGILAKYLIGQAPAYASYIAIGCGAKPLASDAVLSDYSQKKNLDFEMFRIPIVSRGYVNENGISKVVLTAELPSEERYEISEVGIFSAGANPSAGAYDSKILATFAQGESWEYHGPTSSSSIPVVYTTLDGSYSDNAIHNDVSGDPAYGMPIFQTNADNRIFTDTARTARFERCRFFNNMIVISGNSSTLNLTGGHLSPATGSSHIHLIKPNIDLNKNSPIDELRLAFTIINKVPDDPSPDKVKILIDFASSDVHNQSGSQYARFEAVLDANDYDFDNNRYIVYTKRLEQLYKSSGFTWNSVDVMKVYASVEVDGVASANYFVCLDALKLENVSSINSLYGMTGYSVIRNIDSQTIIKAANTTNFVEFRFAMDVQ
jgi:hypothetical protein